MADSLYSEFDVMNGLESPTDALAPPQNIIRVEGEHEYAVAVTLPPAGLDGVGVDRERVPDPDPHPALDPDADLARALEDFQELERMRFGVNSSRDVSSGPEIIHEVAEDYYPSEDESTQE